MKSMLFFYKDKLSLYGNRLANTIKATGASIPFVISGSAFATVPSPPAPSTSPAPNDAIAWFKGVFEDSSEVAILIIGVALFLIGAIGMVWAIVQVFGGRKSVSEVATIGLASAVGIAFGTWALTQATAII